MIDLAGTSFLDSVNLLSSIKIAVLFAEAIYAVFAFIVVKQTALMNKSFQTGIHALFTLISQIHFFAAVALLILSLIIL